MKGDNILKIALTVILTSGLIMAGVYAYRQVDNAGGEDKLIGGDKDEHGCLIAAGYSWCEAKQKCLRTWEEPCEEPDRDKEEAASGIKQAFIAKYGKKESQVWVEVKDLAENHARGSVKFSMNNEPGEGGIFLAYKEAGIWKLAFDGNGMYDCAEMEEYGFPAEMIPDCADREANVMGGVQLPNPASVYCQEQGGTTDIRTDAEGNQTGYCVFEDGREYDEWMFYRGKK